MNIIGRQKETDKIEQCLLSNKPEFMVVYGRRRVGKTYLIKEYFNYRFSFYATGMSEQKTRSQLKAFKENLTAYGHPKKTIPRDWFEAFGRLREILESDCVYRDPASGRRVIFLDEVPWMDTARSDFKSALDFFWNSWGSTQKDILLIVCGSATSWIMTNILFSKGGFYNRITRQLLIDPFTLKECEEYYSYNGLKMNRNQIIDSYMVFGGIPYYMSLMDRRMSLVQNIDTLIFDSRGELHYEYDHLMSSLFKNSANHKKILTALASERRGLPRTELISRYKMSDGNGLTSALNELEQCGFIRKYKSITCSKNSGLYQLIDPFVLFAHTYLTDNKVNSWQKFYKSASYYAWRGNAFEIVCLNHISKIKEALGISGISSTEYSWRSKSKKDGAQIDLLIDRKDDVINLCEMKYSDSEYVIDHKYRNELINKEDVFRAETKCTKAVFLTLICANGTKNNEYSDVIQNFITGNDLF